MRPEVAMVPADFEALLRVQARRLDGAVAMGGQRYLAAGIGDLLDLQALADDLRAVADAISISAGPP